MKKNKSSILLSIFKRNGGEGSLTKIITDDNKLNFLDQIALIKPEEQALLCYKQDELNWLLITNSQIIEEKKGVRLVLGYSELTEVTPAIQEEFKNKVFNKEDFTHLIFKDCLGRKHIIKFEKGQPYQGIYQMLHYIIFNNKNET